jgi:hypothetical protein
MAFKWKLVAAGADITVTAGTLPDDWLARINTKVTGASGDADASWEVVSYVAVSPKSLLLRPKDGSAGRIVIFGENGSTPASAAARNPTISLLYIGFSATSTSNTVDASWISAAPLSASDYMAAIPCWQMTGSTTWRLSYVDSPAGIYFLVTLGTTTGCGIAGAGWLVQDLVGNPTPSIIGSGSQTLPTDPLSQATSGNLIPGYGSNNTTTAAVNRLLARVNNFDETLWRVFTPAASFAKLRDSTNKRAHFFQIDLMFGSNDMHSTIFGKFRQVAFGPTAIRETTLESTGSPSLYAYPHTYHNASAVNAIWFTDFEV